MGHWAIGMPIAASIDLEGGPNEPKLGVGSGMCDVRTLYGALRGVL